MIILFNNIPVHLHLIISKMVITLKTIVIFLCFFSAVAKFKTFNQIFDKFSDDQKSKLEFDKNSTLHLDALQVTLDTANPGPGYNLNNLSGGIMFPRSFRLWDGDVNSSSPVASFNTSFLISISPPIGSTDTQLHGEGLAFLIAPTIRIPDNSSGKYLGLYNASTNNQSNNGIVAVELDTVKQDDFDIDDNHIGLNIHSIKSVVSKPLSEENIILFKTNSYYNIWIQYNGLEKIIRVYIATQQNQTSPTPPMPNTPIIQYDLDLRKTVNSESYIGFAASTGENYQLNCVLRWNFTVEYIPGPKSQLMAISLGVGIPVVVGLVALIAYYLYKMRLVKRSQSNFLNRLRTLPGMPKEFRFRDLNKATNNFDEKRKLGQGGYGVVYRGVLAEDDAEVAVKWFSRESLKGEDDFLAELTIINRLRHKHLVRLLGWCHKNGKLLLVYEYMRNGSLDKHLFTKTGDPLNWTLRRKILSGVASALHYLHYEYNQKVVHRDIKASNIMLDSDFNACLGDFGLARAIDNQKTSYAEAEGMLGTIGYIAPECYHTWKATQQSDIYAFGTLLIEVVSGQRAGTKVNGMVEYVWSLYREGRILDAVDNRIVNDYDRDEAQQLLLLGLACSHPIASERPNTHSIVQILSGATSVPPVPHVKPAFVWPAAIDDPSQATSIKKSPLSIDLYEDDSSQLVGR